MREYKQLNKVTAKELSKLKYWSKHIKIFDSLEKTGRINALNWKDELTVIGKYHDFQFLNVQAKVEMSSEVCGAHF